MEDKMSDSVTNLKDFCPPNKPQEDGIFGFITEDSDVLSILELAQRYAKTDGTMLIMGETGTGKEVIAKIIKETSGRKYGPYVVVNCAAIPKDLLESELFGYVKGAFSGANDKKNGLFHAANKGTIFLDEIGEMDISLQGALLRVLDGNGEYTPIGATKSQFSDFRLIAATNRNLLERAHAGDFRMDLYQRLQGMNIQLPGLRQRRMDIPVLIQYFLKQDIHGLGQKQISDKAMTILMQYEWPGNVRELKSEIEALTVRCTNEIISVHDLPKYIVTPENNVQVISGESETENLGIYEKFSLPEDVEEMTWEEVEREYARHILERARWNVTKASQLAGVNRSTFASRIRKLGLSRKN